MRVSYFAHPCFKGNKMQYWLNFKTNKMERLEDEILSKHPELLEFLKSKGYVRVMSETDHAEYKNPVKRRSVKKAVKKITKKVSKKKK
jgi:hypothetical protein